MGDVLGGVSDCFGSGEVALCSTSREWRFSGSVGSGLAVLV